MQIVQNLRYAFQFSKQDLPNKELLDAKISVLGQKIANVPCEKKKELLLQVYSRTLWFTYRKNFPSILNSNITSDSGWGCMLRAGQMIWAQILRNHLREKKNVRNYQFHLLCSFVDDDNEEYKQLFTDQPLLSPYSILKIMSVSQLKFQLQPGQWYRPDGIIASLSELHQHHPMKGSDDLLILSGESLYYDQIYSEMFGFRYNCEHTIEMIQEHDEYSAICQKCQRQQPKSIAFFLHTRLGADSLNTEYLDVLFELMDVPYFQGLIGGHKDKAYYIIGRVDNRVVYLDPHLVQEAISIGNVISHHKSFFTNNVQYMDASAMSPSMSIGFYLKGEKELDDLFTLLEELQKKYDRDKFFCTIRRLTLKEMIVPGDLSNAIIDNF